MAKIIEMWVTEMSANSLKDGAKLRWSQSHYSYQHNHRDLKDILGNFRTPHPNIKYLKMKLDNKRTIQKITQISWTSTGILKNTRNCLWWLFAIFQKTNLNLLMLDYVMFCQFLEIDVANFNAKMINLIKIFPKKKFLHVCLN